MSSDFRTDTVVLRFPVPGQAVAFHRILEEPARLDPDSQMATSVQQRWADVSGAVDAAGRVGRDGWYERNGEVHSTVGGVPRAHRHNPRDLTHTQENIQGVM